MPELVGVALQKRRVLVDLADIESQMRRLLRNAATGTKVDVPITLGTFQ
jgi:hypothetical protein